MQSQSFDKCIKIYWTRVIIDEKPDPTFSFGFAWENCHDGLIELKANYVTNLNLQNS